VEFVKDINSLLAMPSEFHQIVKGKRRPIQEHFGSALFPIVPSFDTGFGPVTIQRLAKAIIDREKLAGSLAQFYRLDPTTSARVQAKSPGKKRDALVEQETLLRLMLYDYACLESFGMPYKRLLAEVGKGIPGALFKVVQVDKTFVVGPYGASLIIKKQHEADWSFFEKLGDAIRRKPVEEQPYLFKAKLISAYLWDSAFAGASFASIVRALEGARVLAPSVVNPQSFAKMLNRQGLKRTKYNRK